MPALYRHFYSLGFFESMVILYTHSRCFSTHLHNKLSPLSKTLITFSIKIENVMYFSYMFAPILIYHGAIVNTKKLYIGLHNLEGAKRHPA